MPTLEEIKKQIDHLDGVSRLLARGEIKQLPRILWEDERVEKLVQGTYEDSNGVLPLCQARVRQLPLLD